MLDKKTPQDILQLTRDFLVDQRLPALNWPELSDSLAYWLNRHDGPKSLVIDTLPALVYGSLGGCIEKALPLNSSWLLYLIAARVFDDIQDAEGEGRPWNRQDQLFALPIGIGLMSAAALCLSYQEAPESTLRSLQRNFSTACIEAAKAQRYEMVGMSDCSVLESYFSHIIGATAKIFAAGAWAGGCLFGADERTLETLSEFGFNLGMKCAILDDCRDLTSSEFSQSDLANGRYRLPVLYALAKPIDRPIHSHLCTLLLKSRGDEAIAAEIVNILGKMGAVAWCFNLAQVYQQKALAALEMLPDDAKGVLVGYA